MLQTKTQIGETLVNDTWDYVKTNCPELLSELYKEWEFVLKTIVDTVEQFKPLGGVADDKFRKDFIEAFHCSFVAQRMYRK